MAKKQFKAESKRLLEMMIHSIYTHREIFLRELISNASDAIDKLYYRSLQEGLSGLSRDDFAITLVPDRAARTLTITDNGCGMTEAELSDNLGTIAKSGSLSFKREQEASDEIDIIGQFGVGFYSAFMVSDEVYVLSRAFGEETAHLWHSKGADGYTVKEAARDSHGTTIILHIKDNTEDENYDEFLDEFRLTQLVKRYSDYIRYPIQMTLTRRSIKEGTGVNGVAPEMEETSELTTLNSMTPIWKKQKSEVTEEELNAFYRDKFFDYDAPMKTIQTSTEGASTYHALLFIPSHAPYDYYTKEYEKGLQLYASGVLIMDKCADLLPDHFSFVKGLVDSQDLSLNISREMLQHDRQLKLIASRLEKKIRSELLSLLKNDRAGYEAFFTQFGLQLKYGVYADYGVHKDVLEDLLLFYSSKDKQYVTLGEYVDRMEEGQSVIYYATGETLDRIDRLPQTERLKQKGVEILYLVDQIDEFALKVMAEYRGKTFSSVSDANVGADEDEEAAALAEANGELMRYLTDVLSERVQKVKLSTRLISHPVCLTSEGELTLDMEKTLNAQPNGQKVQAVRVLELNAKHPVFAKMQALFVSDAERLKEYASLLYDLALMIEGLPIDDPAAFSDKVCRLMAE